MTDKQIIIDGVDVVECPHRKKEVTFMNVIKCYNYGVCEGVNCLYKQLKAKERECEELKKRLESFQKDYSKLYQVVENKGYIKELDQLKAENDKLKQTLDEIEKTCLFKIENRQFVLPNVWQYFLDVVNKVKDNK